MYQNKTKSTVTKSIIHAQYSFCTMSLHTDRCRYSTVHDIHNNMLSLRSFFLVPPSIPDNTLIATLRHSKENEGWTSISWWNEFLFQILMSPAISEPKLHKSLWQEGEQLSSKYFISSNTLQFANSGNTVVMSRIKLGACILTVLPQNSYRDKSERTVFTPPHKWPDIPGVSPWHHRQLFTPGHSTDYQTHICTAYLTSKLTSALPFSDMLSHSTTSTSKHKKYHTTPKVTTQCLGSHLANWK